MKNLVKILNTVAIAATLASCAKEETVGSADITSNGQHNLCVNLESGVYQEESGTKAATEAVVRVRWTAGDKVSVINLTKGKLLGGQLAAAEDGTSVKFSGTVTGDLTSGDRLVYVYPAIKENTEEENFTSSSQSLSSQTYDASSTNVAFYGYAEDTYSSSYISKAIRFNLATSYVHLNMSGLAASMPVKTVSVSNLNGGFAWAIEGDEFKVNSYLKNEGITVTCTGVTSTAASGNAIVRFAVPASDGVDERTLSVNDSLKTAYAKAARIAESYYNQLYSNWTKKVTITEDPVSGNTNVVINDAGTEKVAANLPAETSFVEDKITDITVGGVGTIVFDADATNKIKSNAEEESATNVFFMLQNVTEKETTEPNEVVYEITMKAVNEEGAEVYSESKADGTATISVPLPDADPSVTPTVYLFSSGAKGDQIDPSKVSFTDGILSFTVEHFSEYAIDYTKYAELVAETDGRKYPTMEAAIAAAVDGHTVRLLNDYTVNSGITISKGLTLNLGSHTLTAACSGYIFDLNTEDAGKAFRITGGSNTELAHIASNGTEEHSGVVCINTDCETAVFEMDYVCVHGATEADAYVGISNDNNKSLISDQSSESDLVKLINCSINTTSVILGGSGNQASASLYISGGSYTGAKGFRYAGTEKSVVDGASITSTAGIAFYPYSTTDLKNSDIVDTSTGTHDAVSVGGDGSVLTITNTTVNTKSKTAVAAESLGLAIIESGTFKCTTSNTGYAVLRTNTSGGEVRVNGGTIDASLTQYAAFANTFAKSYPDDPSGIVFNGGTITGGSEGFGCVSSDHATIDINGGTFKTDVGLEAPNNSSYISINEGATAVFEGKVTGTGAVIIPAGTFKKGVADGDLADGSTITGGTFYEAAPYEGYIPEGYSAKKQETTPESWKVESAYWKDYTAKDFSSKSGNTVTITNASELALFAKNVNDDVSYTGYTFKLGNDIDLSAHEWNPIMLDEDCATGLTFDGNGKTISGLKMTRDESFTGLFGTFFSHSSTVKNLTVSNPQITQTLNADPAEAEAGTGLDYTAALVAHLGCGKIEGCTVTGGTVSGVEQVGAIVGYLACGTIKNCTVNGGITISGSNNRVGGITGKTNCDNIFAVEDNTVENATVTSAGKHGICGAAALVGQIIAGSEVGWTITGNTISNVTTTTEGDSKFVPIGEFRTGYFQADAVSGNHIVNNSWDKSISTYYDMVNPSNTSEYVRILNKAAQE